MEIFEGVCVGGPYSGKRFGSYKRENRVNMFVRPLSVADGYALVDNEAQVVRYKTGLYHYVDKDKEWRWNEPA